MCVPKSVQHDIHNAKDFMISLELPEYGGIIIRVLEASQTLLCVILVKNVIKESK
jgi:hypothetical protein